MFTWLMRLCVAKPKLWVFLTENVVCTVSMTPTRLLTVIVEEIQASLIQQMKSLNARHAILFKHTKSVLEGAPAEAPRHHVMYAPTKIST